MTRTDELMDDVRRRIASGQLGAGERLPSVRRHAAAMGVSPSTVVEAYDRLVAEGAIRSRPGSGFYVAGSSAPFSLQEPRPDFEREIDPLWVSRQSLDADGATLRPGCGWLPSPRVVSQGSWIMARRAARRLCAIP